MHPIKNQCQEFADSFAAVRHGKLESTENTSPALDTETRYLRIATQ